MADGPSEATGPPFGARERNQTAGAARRSGLRLAAAVTTTGVLVGLVACDFWVPGTRAWWDRHSFTSCVVSSLLVLGVTVLILDEVLARRQRKERAGSVAVQALIVYGQAVRSCDAVVAMAGIGAEGDRAELDVAQVDVRDEVRSLANMILVASPALFDDPEARLFLEEVQRLAGTMYSALAMYKISATRPPGDGDGIVGRLRAARLNMGARVGPLAARLADKDRAPLDTLVHLATRRSGPARAPAQEKVNQK
ncbi:MAG TPA: hypothetical protein VME46_08305 [Acidimicrobiales bacterium]|nr:hypothetical protein [Acidimicrobiales bacterium]